MVQTGKRSAGIPREKKMSNSSLAKTPLYLAAIIIVVGAALFAAPYFTSGLPWAPYADYIAFGTVGLTVLLLLLSLLLGRKSGDGTEAEEESLSDLREDAPDTYSGTEVYTDTLQATEPVPADFDVTEVAETFSAGALIPPPGLSKSEERRWLKEEKRRLADEAKFRRAAEKEAAKAAKKAEREARRGRRKGGQEVLDASPEAEDWVNSVQAETLAAPETYVTEETVTYVEETAEPQAILPVAEVQDTTNIETVYSEFEMPQPTLQPSPATDDPLFKEDEMSPGWITATYHDDSFEVPFSDVEEIEEDAAEVTEGVAEVAEEEVISEDSLREIEEEEDSPVFGLVNSFASEVAAMIEEATERAARVEGSLSTLETELEYVNAELEQTKRENDELKATLKEQESKRLDEALIKAHEEAEQLRTMLDDVQGNLEHVLSTQGTMTTAAASAERAKLMTRLMGIRAILSTSGTASPDAMRALEELVDEVGHGHHEEASALAPVVNTDEIVEESSDSIPDEVLVESEIVVEDESAILEEEADSAFNAQTEAISETVETGFSANTENDRY